MLLATTEICGVPVAVILFWAWWAWYAHHQDQIRKNITWRGSMYAPLDIPIFQDFAQEYFCVHGNCSQSLRTSSVQVFTRGDLSIEKLPQAREVFWAEVPVKISLTYSRTGDGTTINVRFAAPEEMQFDETSVTFFHNQAEEEFDLLLKVVEQLLIDRQEHVADQGSDSEPAHSSDYDTLGLEPDASWSQVKAAYRAMALKYHPDRLSGHNVPEHIKQLAVEKFKRITHAYQRLRNELGSED